MFDRDVLDKIIAAQHQWQKKELRDFTARQPETHARNCSASGIPVQRLYTPADLADARYEEIGLPGQYPFTRGPYPTMYRGRLWTMRQIAGYGTGQDTNRRFKYLIEHGQTGLSVDFDMPTLMGYDSDDPRSLGEVGREGVAIDTIEDMEDLFAGIDLEQISVSMTINPTAWILFAMYLAVAERRGYDRAKLSGTVQTDILKEYIAQKEWIFPIRPSVRIMRDLMVYSTRNLPRYNPINLSGYHINEAGATSVQEIAFTMANAIAVAEAVTEGGIQIDDFAPRLAFFFVSQADFFEEVAKFRAARRVYAKIMKERFGAQKPESMRLRFHCQTAAATLTKAQPLNNIVRTTLQALSAVLGGAQSLHTNGLDEAYAIPSEQAMKVALRTQQIIAEETNIPNVVDPLGGSYYVEALTNKFEAEVFRIIKKVDGLGGAVAAIEKGYFQAAIADSAYGYAKRKESGERVVVGVNRYVDPPEPPNIQIHKIDPVAERHQVERLRKTKTERDNSKVNQLLAQLAEDASDTSKSLMPVTIELVKARASMGEIVQYLKKVFGTYVETPVF